VNLQAVNITGLGHQVGGHLRAFCHGGNNVDDMVVGYALQGLQSGNKCVGVADRVSPTRDPVLAEPTTTREVVLPFVAEDDTYRRAGGCSHDPLLGARDTVVGGGLADDHQHVWALGSVSFVVRGARPEGVIDGGLGLTEFVPRDRGSSYVCNIDMFGGEAVVHALKTRGRISINGFIIPNPHETLAHQFLGVA
jgi:hypothetical protein